MARLVLAEDQALLRDGLTRILRAGGHDVVEAVADAPSLARALTRDDIDGAVLDVRLPPTHTTEGLLAAIEARRHRPGLPVVVLSQWVEAAYARELLADDAARIGYLLKDRVADVGAFLDALDRVLAGGTALDPEVVTALVAHARVRPRLGELSPREVEVLEQLAQGRSNAGIAERLVVSAKAVEKHVANIFTKLDLAQTGDDNRRVLAVLAWLDRG